MSTFNEILSKIVTYYNFENKGSYKILNNIIEAYNETNLDKIEETQGSICLESVGNDINQLFWACESIKDKIKENKRRLEDELFISKSNFKPVLPRLVTKKVSDEDFEEFKSWIQKMREVKTFKEYKKYYDKVANYFGFPSNGSGISALKMTKGKKGNDNIIQLLPWVCKKKIKIPNGVMLYHRSPVNNIKELKPSFRGKKDELNGKENGKFYSSERIYFSMNRPTTKHHADNSGRKDTIYTPVEKILTAFIDPALSGISLNSVYIETHYPVKVTTLNNELPLTESEDIDVHEDERFFATLEEFMEYYGLEFADDGDEFVKESFASMIGKHKREKESKEEIKNAWDSVAGTLIKHKNIEKKVDEKTFKEIKEAHETISTTDDYSKYKKAYSKICKFFSVNPKDVIIEHLIFNKDGDKIRLIFGNGRKKIIIPNGCQLIHVSPANNIPHLIPSFRSKTKGSYLYPDKRVYFTISKEIKGKQCGLSKVKERHVYTPKENIKTAYIDQSYPLYSVGAVYIQTDGNVPVNQLK